VAADLLIEIWIGHTDRETKMDPSTPLKAQAAGLIGMIEFARDGIVSKTVIDETRAKVVLFCMEKGQSLSQHTASMPATIQVMQGHASVLMGEERLEAEPGSFYYMPAQLNHAIDATEDMVFLLTLFKGA
jgi:quercetin dioxygenase-like cupin family protein